MSPILQALLNAVVKYLEDHPDEVEKIAALIVDLVVKEINKANG